MTINLSSLPLPQESAEHFVHVVHSLLAPSECESLINEHQTALGATGVAVSTRLRHIFDSEALSSTLWTRLSPYYANTTITDEEGQIWKASHLNMRFRFCKYKPGDAFVPHFDGRLLLNENEQSFLTVNIYLNTVPETAGGCTRVLDKSKPGLDGQKYKVIAKVQPTVGMAAVFRDSLFHDGEELKAGVKYLLRTDVIFAREVPFDFNCLYAGLTPQEKGKKALDLAAKLEDSGDKASAVGWYRKAFRYDPDLELAS